MRKFKDSLKPSGEVKRNAKRGLVASLTVAEQVLGGVPIPGAQAVVTLLLDAIRGIEVSSLSSRLSRDR